LPKDKEQRHGQCCPAYVKLDIRTQNDFYSIEKFLGGISLLFKRIINNRECQSIFSRSTIRKLFNLLNIQSIDSLQTEYEKYKNLCKAYDSQIIEIAFNNGIYISPVQLSLLLYSDIEHELTIEITRKNFAIPDTFTKSVVKLLEILKQADVERKDLSDFEKKFKFLLRIYLN
ncbi:unnamed protein product, partial [Rotaria sp. Silwood2]